MVVGDDVARWYDVTGTHTHTCLYRTHAHRYGFTAGVGVGMGQVTHYPCHALEKSEGSVPPQNPVE